MQILRVVPYSATQLYSYEVLKKRFQNGKGELSISSRLAAGGLAGMVATLVSCLCHMLLGILPTADAHRLMRVAPAHGPCIRPMHMAHAHGPCTWLVHMSCAHGSCTWLVRMAHAHGSSYRS